MPASAGGEGQQPERYAGLERVSGPPVKGDVKSTLLDVAAKPFDPDYTRMVLVVGLLLALFSIIGLGFAGLFSTGLDVQKNFIQVIGLFISPVTTLLGAATGFYFGKEAAGRKRPPS